MSQAAVCCVLGCVSCYRGLDRCTSSRWFGIFLSRMFLPALILCQVHFYFTASIINVIRMFGLVGTAFITTCGLFILFNIVVCYFAIQMIGPGYATPSASPEQVPTLKPASSSLITDSDDLNTEDGDSTEAQEQPQVCAKCDALRVVGTHHCSTCKRCVLQQDHHCPWVDTCVGEKNRKYFINFILWLGLGSSFCALACFPSMHIYPYRFVADKWNLCMFTMAAGMTPALFGFLLWHVYLVMIPMLSPLHSIV
eukprot:TRINITY_DN3889_c0_g1_i1.p1 TRINITY_DN3889_c0_g1~~TRINITY_DN3889_c0_g1_i1.p1  ORF type:complete len:253 (+),score=36.72 TRINITY_DN3889_c0_g1_i1:48-806(+)